MPMVQARKKMRPMRTKDRKNAARGGAAWRRWQVKFWGQKLLEKTGTMDVPGVDEYAVLQKAVRRWSPLRSCQWGMKS